MRKDTLVRSTGLYLQALRGSLSRANQSRKGWISQVGLLLADLQHGTSRDVVAAIAGRSGATQGEAFREIRAEVARLEPAPGCETCHLAVLSWLDKHTAACDLLIEIGNGGSADLLREVQGLIAEARHDARQFSYEIAERLAILRHRNRAARRVEAPRARVVARPLTRAPARPAPAVARRARTGGLIGRLVRAFSGRSAPQLAGAA
jgi:hypothetical protein